MSSGADRPSKKDRQSAAREKARLIREEAQRKARRRRWIVQGSVGVGILAVLAIIAIVLVNAAAPVPVANPKNMLSDGIVLTSSTTAVTTPAITKGGKPTPTPQADDGKAHIVEYIDYQCPYCQEFEQTNSSQIKSWLDAGTATLEVHPIAILDRSSDGNRYSSRTANAAACVAQYDPSDFFAMTTAFYNDQPAESTNGRTDSQILATMKTAGINDPDVTRCVKKEAFKDWVTAETARAQAGVLPNSDNVTLQGTPTVLVNGKAYSGSLTDASAFQSFVESTVAAGSSSPSSTPTPTPSS